jgi:hypothetical protein
MRSLVHLVHNLICRPQPETVLIARDSGADHLAIDVSVVLGHAGSRKPCLEAVFARTTC